MRTDKIILFVAGLAVAGGMTRGAEAQDAQAEAGEGSAVTALTAPEVQPEPAAPQQALVQHRPVAQSVSGADVRLHFRVVHPELAGEVAVYVRPEHRRGAPQRIVMARGDADYFAVVPAELVEEPGFAYWAVSRAVDGHEEPVFASETDPHHVVVVDAPARAYERAALARRGGRRSRAIVSGEYVDFGTRRLRNGDQRLPDHYYRLEASYTYDILEIVDEIRFSVGRVRGEAAKVPEDSEDGMYAPFDLGIDYGGAEVTWLATPMLRFTTSILFGFSQEGFEYGGSGSMIIGDADAMTLTLGLEGVTTLGVTGRVRLGWTVVPRVTMGATVEVTTYPAGEDAGVRLLQDLGYELYPGATIRVRGGYQSRTSVNGGLSAGGELALAF